MNSFHRWFCRSDYWRKALEAEIFPWALDGIDLGQELLEIGPGPGLTTDILRTRASSVTSIEIDPALAASLKQRMQGSNVTVVEADATKMPFEDGRFSAAVSFTMLHHVPNPTLQDRLLAEVRRVLKPGAVFAGTDSLVSFRFKLIHLFDAMTIVAPNTFGARLKTAGFDEVSVEAGEHSFRFRARRSA
jgi:SAM-dependent methyltransferase